MIYLEIFWAFLKVGLFAFGGHYGAIPLIRNIVVLSNGWMSDEMFTYFIALSESTPGPIMVNIAAYIGNNKAGIGGASLATIGVVLPSYIMILFIAGLFKNIFSNIHVQAVFKGIRPCFIGFVLAMGLYLIINNIFIITDLSSVNWQALLITIILFIITFGYKRIAKKNFSPIMLIVFSAGLGILLYSF